ncbi:MAG: hypothetical protein HKN36_13905 [Hellea sp.]|nr:hypothetical protein [Hellea sp.]
MADADIIAVETKAHIRAFLNFPYELYKDDPQWRAPLRFERAAQITPEKNPVLHAITDQKFLAMRGDKCVGRIAAFINHSHQEQHKDGAGHFGFLDFENNPETGRALLTAAQDWLMAKGAKKILGPNQWSVNEETGLLVDGFDTPPVVLMPFGQPYYQKIVEDFGFEKATDMYAFQNNLHEGFPRPKTTQMMRRLAIKDKGIKLRPVNKSKFKEEIAIAMSIFNDAWSENWGFVPFTDDQIDHMAKEMKPLVDKDLFQFGEIDGEVMTFGVIIPDINSAAHGLNGKLFPFGILKFLYRLKIKGVKQARLPLLGLRKKAHNSRRGLALTAHLCETLFENARDKGFTQLELSWILEDNASMIRICEQASSVKYKTYRMYEKQL